MVCRRPLGFFVWFSLASAVSKIIQAAFSQIADVSIDICHIFSVSPHPKSFMVFYGFVCLLLGGREDGFFLAAIENGDRFVAVKRRIGFCVLRSLVVPG